MSLVKDVYERPRFKWHDYRQLAIRNRIFITTLLAIGCLLHIIVMWMYFLLKRSERYRFPTSRADLWPLMLPIILLMPEALYSATKSLRDKRPGSEIVKGRAFARLESNVEVLHLGITGTTPKNMNAMSVLNEIQRLQNFVEENSSTTGFYSCEHFVSLRDDTVDHLFVFYFDAVKKPLEKVETGAAGADVPPYGANIMLKEWSNITNNLKDETIGMWYERYLAKSDSWDSLYVNTAPVGIGSTFIKALVHPGEPGFEEAQKAEASLVSQPTKSKKSGERSRSRGRQEQNEEEAEKLSNSTPRVVYRSILHSIKDKLKKEK